MTHMGQPALLYLCPLTLGAVLLTAAQRKQLKNIWAFTDTTATSGSSRKKQQEDQQQQQGEEGGELR